MHKVHLLNLQPEQFRYSPAIGPATLHQGTKSQFSIGHQSVKLFILQEALAHVAFARVRRAGYCTISVTASRMTVNEPALPVTVTVHVPGVAPVFPTPQPLQLPHLLLRSPSQRWSQQRELRQGVLRAGDEREGDGLNLAPRELNVARASEAGYCSV